MASCGQARSGIRIGDWGGRSECGLVVGCGLGEVGWEALLYRIHFYPIFVYSCSCLSGIRIGPDKIPIQAAAGVTKVPIRNSFR